MLLFCVQYFVAVEAMTSQRLPTCSLHRVPKWRPAAGTKRYQVGPRRLDLDVDAASAARPVQGQPEESQLGGAGHRTQFASHPDQRPPSAVIRPLCLIALTRRPAPRPAQQAAGRGVRSLAREILTREHL